MSIRELARTVDERLADLSWADYTFAVERGIIKDTIRRYAGQKCDWRTREWDGTFEDALAATPEPWDKAQFENAKAAYERNLAISAQNDEEIAEYVQALEERGDAEVDVTETLAKIDGDQLAAEFERYLRRRGPGFRG